MLSVLTEPFSYDFMLRALIIGVIVAICSALLGVVLVLKRFSMIGDGLSHVGFGLLAIATALGLAPLRIAVVGVIICAFLLMRLNENSKVKGDALIALLSSGALAAGIVISSFGKGANIDLNSFLFGSILATTSEDVWFSISMGICVSLFFVVFYNKLFAITFDESFSKAGGINVSWYKTMIAVLTALTIVIGMRLIGTLLISSFLVFPPLSAMRICKKFKSVIISSVIISILLVISGLYMTYYFDLPTGASIVCIGIIIYCILFMYEKLKMIIKKLFKPKSITNNLL